MKDLYNLFQQCMYEVEAAGIEPGHIVKIEINTRAQNRWGQCRKRGNDYSLNFAERILRDDTDEKGVKETIIHEILHTCKGCMNHGKEWNRLGAIMEKKYGYKIERTGGCEDFGIDINEFKAERQANMKYRVVCEKCGNTWYKTRACKITKYPQYYKCNCGGSLNVFTN